MNARILATGLLLAAVALVAGCHCCHKATPCNAPPPCGCPAPGPVAVPPPGAVAVPAPVPAPVPPPPNIAP
jgi:hypothetical protein